MTSLSVYDVNPAVGRLAKRVVTMTLAYRVVHVLADRAERIDGEAQAIVGVVHEARSLIVSCPLHGRQRRSDCAFAVLRQRRACGPPHGVDDIAPRVVHVLADRAERIDGVAQSIRRIVGVRVT